MKPLKLTLVIITIFSLVLTILLGMARAEGLHPNIAALAVIMPLAGLFLWAALTMAETKIHQIWKSQN